MPRQIDKSNLAETGWGVIFSHHAAPAIKTALAPLLQLRQAQAGEQYHAFVDEQGYQPYESNEQFLQRQGIRGGQLNPRHVPYYLLLVGSPADIPYRFQQQLSIRYAVGRLHFDRPADYAQYAQTVVAVAQGNTRRQRQIDFFSPGLGQEDLTAPMTKQLMHPLVAWLQEQPFACQTTFTAGEAATKTRLQALLNEGQAALLMAASRGRPLSQANLLPRQHQGSLLCYNEASEQTTYFSAADLNSITNLRGLITFLIADYSLGTPPNDTSPPFVTDLAKQLLSDGALAVVGNLGPIQGYTYYWPTMVASRAVFESCLTCLLTGQPLGAAMQYFGHHYAELGAEYYMMRQERQTDTEDFRHLRNAYQEAGCWGILGDPAVRLAI